MKHTTGYNNSSSYSLGKSIHLISVISTYDLQLSVYLKEEMHNISMTELKIPKSNVIYDLNELMLSFIRILQTEYGINKTTGNNIF